MELLAEDSREELDDNGVDEEEAVSVSDPGLVEELTPGSFPGVLFFGVCESL